MYPSLERAYEKLSEKYRNVYLHEIDDEIYIYKLLSKLEYEALTSQIEDELDLQDAIVANCVLYPENLNVDEMLPGTVFELAQVVGSQSCVSPEDRLTMLEVYSEEMGQLDNIMSCIIMHTFPVYKMEDLDNMTFPELYKLYTRAEWTLINVKQEQFIFSARDVLDEIINGPATPKSDYYSNGHDQPLDEDGNPVPQPEQSENLPNEGGQYMGRNLNEVMGELNNSGSKRKPMTEEQKKELEKFKREFPEIDMNNDAMYTGILSEKAGVPRGVTRKKY